LVIGKTLAPLQPKGSLRDPVGNPTSEV
jgi:hypothetical protein